MENHNLLVGLMIALVVVNFGAMFLFGNNKVSFPTAEEIAGKVRVPTPVVNVPTAEEIASKVVVPTQPTPVVSVNGTVVPVVQEPLNNGKLDAVYDKLTKEDQAEAKAVELAKAEVNTKDFKKAVQKLLNNKYNASRIESYKDVKEVSIKDVESNVDDEEAEVTLEVKVKYLLEGDTDLEDAESAKVVLTVFVDKLDFDDKFVDAEVSWDYEDLTFVKFY